MKASRAITVVVLAAFASASSGAQSSTVRPKLGDNPQLFVVTFPGGSVTRLRSDRLDYSVPAWRPDGRRLAVAAGTFYRGAVYVLTPSGRRTHRFPAGDGGSAAAWSPDGRRLAYLRSRDDRRTGATVAALRVVRPRDGREHRVADIVTGVPDWSPDGGTIAFEHGAEIGVGGGPPTDVRTVPSRGGRERVLMRHVDEGTSPQWSADGRRLLVERVRGDYSELWTMGRRGHRRHRVVGHTLGVFAHWVPRRRRAIVAEISHSQRTRLFLFRPHRRPRGLAAKIGGVWEWSPTRDLIAWAWTGAIHVARPDGSHDRVLARIRGADIDDLAWSPNGRRLAVTALKHQVED